MTQPEPRPAMTMRQIREGLGHVKPGVPEVIVSITRYTVSVVPADNINHRYFALSVELTPRGWIVTDGHSGYDADGTAHHGEVRWHPFADYDDALAVARRLTPGLTVNGRTATEVLQRTRETAPAPPVAPLAASQPSEAPVEGETAARASTGRVGDSGAGAAGGGR